MRWAVLGGSSRIYRKALAPALAELGHEVVAAPSRDGESLEPYRAALGRPDVDAVYVPLPNHLHAEWIHRSLDAGKHVLCEKPLTLTAADTREVFDHAAAVGRVVMEAYVWPHHPRAQRLLDMSRDGSIGWPQSGSTAFSWPIDMASGDHRLDLRGAGSLFDLGIYCIAPFLMISRREPIHLTANAVRNRSGVDISMSGWVDWGAGFGSGFHVSFDAPVHRRLSLSCSEAVLEIDEFTPGPLSPSTIAVRRRDGSQHTVECAGASPYTEMVRHFADVVGGADPVFGPGESMRLARILEGLHAASVR